jgi:hypothetical protein
MRGYWICPQPPLGCGQLQVIGGRIQPPAASARALSARTRSTCLFTISFLFSFLFDFFIDVLAFEHTICSRHAHQESLASAQLEHTSGHPPQACRIGAPICAQIGSVNGVPRTSNGPAEWFYR